MGFRVVTIKSRCKLEYSLNYLIYRGKEEKKILLDEISTLIIASTEISLTTALLSALVEKNINVIFCDSKYLPQSQLISLNGTNDCYKKISIQINWDISLKNKLWKSIIKNKIYNQAVNLKDVNSEAYLKLLNYFDCVEDGDTNNREGHAAKVYFNCLFGKDFSRGSDCEINMFLDYGYSIILSCIAREIKSFGYLTEIGIHHIGETNCLNLACDFIEPLRPLIDSYVIKNKVNRDNFKQVFIEMLNSKVFIFNKEVYLENAIHEYVQNMLMNLRNGTLDIEFIKY